MGERENGDKPASAGANRRTDTAVAKAQRKHSKRSNPRKDHMKLSDLLVKDDNDLSDAQLESNRGLRSFIDELGDLEIEAKDEAGWIEKAWKRNLELVAGEPGDD